MLNRAPMSYLQNTLCTVSVLLGTSLLSLASHGAEPVKLDNVAGKSKPASLAPAPDPGGVNAHDEQLTGHGGPALLEHGDYKLTFHGYIRAPLRLGFGKRDNPTADQSKTTIHSPLVPDDQYLSWQHSNHSGRDWAELYWNYGNSWATGTVSIQGFNFTDAAWNQDGAQFGIAQGYVTVRPPLGLRNLRFSWRAGAFSNRYGLAGRYDAGEFDTYLFGRTHSMGELRKVEIDYKDFTFKMEHGLGAVRPDPSKYNTSRFTLLHHGHLGVRFKKMFDFGAHYLTSWSQEESRDGEDLTVLPAGDEQPDGRLTVIGPEIKADLGRFGYYYLGYSYLKAVHAVTVGPAIEVIHAKGGGEFNLGVSDNYLNGPSRQSGGNGTVHTVLAQTEHSLGKILKGDEFWGQGMDVVLKLYAMYNAVGSDDPDMDKVNRLKYGTDLTYSALPWLGVAARYDRLQPNSRIPQQSFSIFSPRVFVRSQWVSHEQISLQYSRYLYNQRSCAEGADRRQCVQPASAPPLPDGFGATSLNQDAGNRGAPSVVPDNNVFSITATMWW